MAEIRHVKEEIRVLGVAVKPSRSESVLNVIGVVFRGRRWLDGVMKATAQDPDVTDRLAEMIASSPHHPQIRVLLVDDSLIEGGAVIDAYRLSEKTARPVILLTTEKGAPQPKADTEAASQRFIMEWEAGSRSVLSIGLRSRVAAKVLEVSTREGLVPEALRVADLVASAVADASIVTFKSHFRAQEKALEESDR